MTLHNSEDLVQRQELQQELGKLEARLQGILDEVQAQNRLLRLGLLSLASRLKKIEDRALSEEKLYEVLERYFDRKKRAQELLLSWGIPAAIVSALAFLLQFFLR